MVFDRFYPLDFFYNHNSTTRLCCIMLREARGTIAPLQLDYQDSSSGHHVMHNLKSLSILCFSLFFSHHRTCIHLSGKQSRKQKTNEKMGMLSHLINNRRRSVPPLPIHPVWIFILCFTMFLYFTLSYFQNFINLGFFERGDILLFSN